VLAEERARAAETMSEIAWEGRRLPVRNNATRLSILNAQDLVAQLGGDAEYSQKEKLFDKLFVQYNDAKRHIRADLAHLSGRTVRVHNGRTMNNQHARMRTNEGEVPGRETENSGARRRAGGRTHLLRRQVSGQAACPHAQPGTPPVGCHQPPCEPISLSHPC
jgi:hypothetical protein